MVKKFCVLLLTTLLLALLTACGGDGRKQPEPDTIAYVMAEATEQTLGAIDPEEYPGLKLENLIPALNDAAFYEITEEKAKSAGFGQTEKEWFVLVPITGGHDLALWCDESEDIVQVFDVSALASSKFPIDWQMSGFFRHHDLYQLVRTAKDYPQQLEHPDYENMQASIELLLNPLTGRLRFGTTWYTDHEVKTFAKVWSYDEDGNQVNIYRLRALAYAKPEEVEELSDWLSLDSQGRYYAVNWWGYVAARFHNGALLGLVRLNEDGSGYTSDGFADFHEDDGWRERMLAAWQTWLTASAEPAEPEEPEDTADMAALLRGIRPADVVINYNVYPKVTEEQAAAALNSAAEHQITETQARETEGYPGCDYPFWGMNIDGVDLYVKCGLVENVVWVGDNNGGEGYFKDETLYELVRHCRDYDEVIDQAAYARFKSQIDAVMQGELEAYANSPGEFHAYQLMNFSPVWTYTTDDGNRAEWYDFDFALIPDRPDLDFWSGGIYMDSQLRVRGFFVCGNVVARYKNDDFLGLVFMASDDLYGTQPFEKDPAWVEAMLAARDGC